MNTAYIFLDFDGVVHPEPCRRELEFCSLPLIEAVQQEFRPQCPDLLLANSRTGFCIDDQAILRRMLGDRT